MSDTTHFSTWNRAEKSCLRKLCSQFFRLFSLNGHFSYAFIYGSWEIIRARKVGTTHTKVDYVVYRLFYPVLLIGACLFSVVAEDDLGKFFCLIEVWCMILHIMYAFLFLQNVLKNNLHRDNVKHRQKIPERLVVTDEIEKGGHKFYICKRYSILPTEKLYYSESLIWFLFNVLASINCTVMLGHMTGFVNIEYKHQDDVENLRAYSMGLLVIADTILTPIPIRFAHVIFPLTYFSMYQGFLILMWEHKGLVLYKSFDRNEATSEKLLERYFAKSGMVCLCHFCLAGLATLRDYVISLFDDSRTPKQLQNLRSQKRLARRKLMNYIEGPDGRITGITLEKNSYVPGADEFIRTENAQKRKSVAAGVQENNAEVNSEEDEELEETKMFRNDGGGDVQVASATAQVDRPKGKSLLVQDNQTLDSIPVTAKAKAPPKPRYIITPERKEGQFSPSSSSSSDEIEAIRKSIKRLPSPPKDPDFDFDDPTKDRKNSSRRQSKIPVPSHKFGIIVKPRDSKENIHHKMDATNDDSPPTPPFVKLVQTLIKVSKQAKGEIEEQRKAKFHMETEDGKAVHTSSGSALVKVVRVVRSEEEKHLLVKPQLHLSKKHASDLQAQKKRKKIANAQARRLQDGKKPDVIDKLISDAVKPSVKSTSREELDQGRRLSGSTGVSRQARGSWDSKSVASKVVHLKDLDLNDDKTTADETSTGGFHQELTDKLKKERNKRLGIPENEESKKRPVGSELRKRQTMKKNKRLKGILKHTEFVGGGKDRLPSAKKQRREKRLLRRRDERALMGKHGQLPYDPLVVPENVGVGGVTATTTFHYLGTRLKGDKVEKTMVPQDDLPLYKQHPGIGTTDEGDVEDQPGRKVPLVKNKSLVTFHPVVKYFDVNEIERKDSEKKNTKHAKKPPSRWAKQNNDL